MTLISNPSKHPLPPVLQDVGVDESLQHGLEKRFETVLAAVTLDSFSYEINGVTTEVRPAHLSVRRNIFNGFKGCVTFKDGERHACSACCKWAALDYICNESYPPSAQREFVTVNQKRYPVMIDYTKGDDRWCPYLIQTPGPEFGYCSIHHSRNGQIKAPLGCDLHPMNAHKGRYNQQPAWVIANYDFGRSKQRDSLKWQHLSAPNVPNKPDCDRMDRPDGPSVQDARRRLYGIKQWAEYFELRHKVDSILTWASIEPIPNEDWIEEKFLSCSYR